MAWGRDEFGLDVITLQQSKKLSNGTLPPALASGGGVNKFNPANSTYNWKSSNTRILRSQLANAKAGVGTCKIACVGDSTTAGYTALAASESWPVVFRKGLATAGFPTLGTGPVVAYPGATGTAFFDLRWTFTGTWVRMPSETNYLYQTNTNGATATFVSDLPGTVVEFMTFNNGGAFTYKIDGGAAVPVTPSGASTLNKITVTGLTNTTHTLLITTTTTTTFYAVWADVRQATSGVWIANFGVNNSKTSDWIETGFYMQKPIAVAWAPKVTFIELGINDWGNSVGAATYKTNMQSLITTFKALGDVVLIIGNPTQNDGTRAAYNQACYQLADSNDIPLIDLYDRLGTWTSMNNLGMITGNDAYHPNNIGYAEKAQGILEALNI